MCLCAPPQQLRSFTLTVCCLQRPAIEVTRPLILCIVIRNCEVTYFPTEMVQCVSLSISTCASFLSCYRTILFSLQHNARAESSCNLKIRRKKCHERLYQYFYVEPTHWERCVCARPQRCTCARAQPTATSVSRCIDCFSVQQLNKQRLMGPLITWCRTAILGFDISVS